MRFKLCTLIDGIFSSKRLFYLILLINIGGTVYGIYYYHLQFLENPPYLWILISDSPNSTMFFAISAVLYRMGRRIYLMEVLASVSLIKYGLWTDFVLLYHSNHFFSPEWRMLYTGIFITHGGMVLEGLALSPAIRKVSWRALPVLGWLIFNDYMDYFQGIHPYMPERNIQFVAEITFFLSFLSVLLFIVARKLCFTQVYRSAEPSP